MADDPNWVIIGQFGRVHGIEGFIRVHSFTETPEDVLHYKNWHLLKNHTHTPIKRLQEKSTAALFLVKMQGFATREAAMQLTNLKIAIPKQDLKPLSSQEFYWFELIGMEVINKENCSLGKVLDIFSTGSNDVLIVEGNKKHLIPFLLKRVIHKIDRQKKQILVDWDENF
ncbi:MAG: 16S rRNA processing protein RimM [Legionellales bacterium RIFCSPHIGHO2_12_FULL_37_14]|nr:MAG: 16S rRNA processing protein RimM [Legionellales bacterium RIFCSPHIGHO2_12_FULL_37_14]